MKNTKRLLNRIVTDGPARIIWSIISSASIFATYLYVLDSILKLSDTAKIALHTSGNDSLRFGAYFVEIGALTSIFALAIVSAFFIVVLLLAPEPGILRYLVQNCFKNAEEQRGR